jgi:hypothetical protein
MSHTYAFEDEFKDTTAKLSDKRRHIRRSSDDGNGSLTYSGASSIGSRSGGESSTDSSVLEIMRLLDAQGDSKELANLLKKHVGRDGNSVAADSLAYSMNSKASDSLAYSANSKTGDSLAYSTDADTYMRSHATQDSNLRGTALISGMNG